MAAGTLTSYVCFERYTEDNSTPPFIQTKPCEVSVSIFAAAVKSSMILVHSFTSCRGKERQPEIAHKSTKESAKAMDKRLEERLTPDQLRSMIPEMYDVLQVVGEGGYGQVVKCTKKDTKETVAIKVPFIVQKTNKEEAFLNKMMTKGLDKQSIVKFFGSFSTRLGRAMIFEYLQLSLGEYVIKRHVLPLKDVKCIVQQLARALDVLKKEGIIHADLKFDNVMLVREERPLQVKLIDFGLAVYRKDMKRGEMVGCMSYRSPESILGLAMTEALDVWSLGIVTAGMVTGKTLFPHTTNFDIIQTITKLIGPVPDKMLQRGIWTPDYYNVQGASFKLKTAKEYYDYPPKNVTFISDTLTSLAEFIETYVNVSDERESDKREGLIDLLSQMMEIDAAKRISPGNILKHPFICGMPIRSHRASSGNCSMYRLPPGTLDTHHKQGTRNFKALTSAELRKIMPDSHNVINLQANGKFGQMFKCQSVQSKELYTVKLAYGHVDMHKELHLMKRLFLKEVPPNISLCTAMMDVCVGKILFYENLDMTLSQYMAAGQKLGLGDVRTVVLQTATALKVLRSMRVIHSEVSLDNVWLCGQTDSSLRVKLAGFDSILHPREAAPGKLVQELKYRAPEVILGLPFNEAIDVWSLGTMMASMLLGFDLFPNRSDYETLKIIVKYFGKPSDQMLSDGGKTKYFFHKSGKSWKLMTHQEYEQRYRLPPGSVPVYRSEKFYTFDQLIRNNVTCSKIREVLELQECIDLMHEMLRMKEEDRITPARIIEHPALVNRTAVVQSVTQTTSAAAPSISDVKKPPQKHRPGRNDVPARPAPSRAETSSDTPDSTRGKDGKKPGRMKRLCKWLRRHFACFICETLD